jgi:hypothetical protein
MNRVSKNIFSWVVLFTILAAQGAVLAQQHDHQESVSIYLDLEREQNIHFLQRPYLEAVLNQLNNPWEIYWPAAALYSLDNREPEIEREQVILKLKQLEEALSSPKRTPQREAVSALREQISDWVLYRRVPILLDYDWVRIRTEHNPRFDAGDYWLKVGARPTTLSLIGAVREQKSIKHQGAAPVFHYMKQIQLNSIADLDWLYVIQASGEVQKIPVAQWNRKNHTLRPGSTLFVPIDVSKLPKRFKTVNEEIVHLLNYWVAK